jgi:uncharacterized integral membrane protein
VKDQQRLTFSLVFVRFLFLLLLFFLIVVIYVILVTVAFVPERA